MGNHFKVKLFTLSKDIKHVIFNHSNSISCYNYGMNELVQRILSNNVFIMEDKHF